MVVDHDQPQEQEGDTSIHWKTWIPVVLCALFFFWWFRDACLVNIPFKLSYPIWMVYTAFISMVIMSFNSWWWLAKLKSPHFIGDNIHGSITGERPTPHGDYFFTRLGGIHYGIVTNRFCEGTAIYPQTSFNRMGHQQASTVRFEPRPLRELPAVVRHAIRRVNYSPPFYYGEVSEEKYREQLKLLKGCETEQEKKEVMARFGDLKKANIGHINEILREECKISEMHARDKAMVMEDQGSMFDHVERLRRKLDKTGGIRNKLRRKKPPEEENY